MMDAGRVEFVKDTALNLNKAYAFQNLDSYCVAPLTIHSDATGSDLPLNSYDFWAVGINCCDTDSSTNTVSFKCGAYKSSKASQGLRLMKDDERSFFRLAVQQATSAHQINSVHPLFFHWTTDATAELESYREKGFKTFA